MELLVCGRLFTEESNEIEDNNAILRQISNIQNMNIQYPYKKKIVIGKITYFKFIANNLFHSEYFYLQPVLYYIEFIDV